MVGLATSLPRPYAPAPTSIPNYNGNFQEMSRKAALEQQFIFDELSQVIEELDFMSLNLQIFTLKVFIYIFFHLLSFFKGHQQGY